MGLKSYVIATSILTAPGIAANSCRDCGGIPPDKICGDSTKGDNEECDDGNTTDGDGCDVNCTKTRCGNGIETWPEGCDDGNLNNGDGCDANCTVTGCGNGQESQGEQCDDGNLVETDTCLKNCKQAVCGDGFIYTGNEECDDANNIDGDGCDSNCTLPGCGNGILDMGEECDSETFFNSGSTCDTNCTRPRCGNGIRNIKAMGGGEKCDDGNSVDGDGCDNNCTISACGNKIRAGQEKCDDGNPINGDGCDSNCTLTSCGNSIVTWPEECDDGNRTNGDGCDNNCQFTDCSNGVQTSGETCDDGNNIDGDGCDHNCTATKCGNGVVSRGEVCDDGNIVDGDGCSVDCKSISQTLEDVQKKNAPHFSNYNFIKEPSLTITTTAPSGLTFDEEARDLFIGQPHNPLTGAYGGSTCFVADEIKEFNWRHGETRWQTVLSETHADVKDFIRQETSIAAGSSIGAFSGSGSVSAILTETVTLSATRKLLLAHYKYVIGSRSLVPPHPQLHPRYVQALSDGNQALFFRECYYTYLGDIEIGKSFLFMLDLTQTNSNEHTESEIKAAFEIKYGNAKATASVEEKAMADRVFSDYSIVKKCHETGVPTSACRKAEDGDIPGAIQMLTDYVLANPNKLEALAVGHRKYSDVVSLKDLDAFLPYLEKIEQWTDAYDKARYVCGVLDYVDCFDLNKKVKSEVQKCISMSADCDSPSKDFIKSILDEMNLGRVDVMDALAPADRRQTSYNFTISPGVVNAVNLFKPDILYKMSVTGFNDRMMAFTSDLSAHWQIVFYQNEDGTGIPFPEFFSKDMAPGGVRALSGPCDPKKECTREAEERTDCGWWLLLDPSGTASNACAGTNLYTDKQCMDDMRKRICVQENFPSRTASSFRLLRK